MLAHSSVLQFSHYTFSTPVDSREMMISNFLANTMVVCVQVQRTKWNGGTLTLINCVSVACAGLLIMRNFNPLNSTGVGAPGPVFRAIPSE